MHIQSGNIQPPWELLNKIERKYIKINDDLNDYLNTLNDGSKIIKEINLNKYNEQLNEIKKHFKRNEIEINDTFHEANRLTDNLENILDDIHIINGKLMNLMAKFDNFGKTNISIVEAVKNGLKILNEIKKWSNVDLKKINDIINKCNRINKEANDIYNRTTIDAQDLKDKLRDINFKLNDLENLTNRIKTNVTIGKTRNNINQQLIEKLNNDITNIKNKYDLIDAQLKEIDDIFESNVKYLNEIEKLHDRYRDMNVDAFLKQVRDKQDDFDENLAILEEQVSKAQKHSKELKKKADEYKRWR